MKITEEQIKKFGETGLKIGKAIVVEGTKALLLKGAAVAITTSFEEGLDGVKNLSLDDVISGKKNKKKDKKEVVIEIDEVEILED